MRKTFFVPLLLLAIFLSLGTFPALAQEKEKSKPLEGDMVQIPAGNFIFGTNEQDTEGEALALGIPKPWYVDEGPQQKIFLKSFYIDRYETTNRRYKAYVDAVGAVAPRDWKNNKYPEDKADYPVVWVNWYDATNFCEWAGKRLPSEKQWEKTARGENGNQYPWGNEFHREYANLPEKPGSKNTIVKVGSFPKGATPLGIYDLAGNAWEWTDDDYAPYKDSTYKSPNYGTGFKVIRGVSGSDIGHFPGSAYFLVLQKFARSGFRQFVNPDEGSLDVGFRCVSDEIPDMAKSSAVSFGVSSPATIAKDSNDAPKSALQKLGGGSAAFNPFKAKPSLPQSGILALILISFAAGLFSFLSPCTLPILPAYFAITAQTDRKRITLMSIAFFIGLATVFVIMGASASFLGQLLRDYIFSLTKICGALVVVFGIMTLFGKGFSGANFSQKPGSSFIGFFLFGATFALGWTPCVGPILSGILILAASDKTILEGMTLLFSYAVGLGFPLIAISAFFGQLDKNNLFWRILRGKGWYVNIGEHAVLLHTTNIFSGLLLILLGFVLAMGYMTYVNNLIPIEIQIWFSQYEEKILHWLM